MSLSESLEDYLEAIAELIALEGHAHTKDIASKLGVKMPSVTGALRSLVEMNLIEYSANQPVVLTDKGREVAERVMHRHQILKIFFQEILGLPVQSASDTACHLEHVIDEETVDRFVMFSEALENRSDAQRLKTYLTEAFGVLSRGEFREVCVLSDIPIGERVVVKKFGRNIDSSAMINVVAGDEITVVGISLDKTSLTVSSPRGNEEIPISIAENIWVRKLSFKESVNA